MAIEKECDCYNECGFVQWRKDQPDNHIQPLPENGDCGINPQDCLRRKSNLFVKIELSEYGATNQREFDESLPPINGEGEKIKRLVGGGHE